MGLLAHGPAVSKELLERLPRSVEKILLRDSEPIELLNSLAKRGCNSVLWECGPELASHAIKQGCVQEIAMMIAPKLLGGFPVGTPLTQFGFNSVHEAFRLKTISKSTFDDDLLIRASFE